LWSSLRSPSSDPLALFLPSFYTYVLPYAASFRDVNSSTALQVFESTPYSTHLPTILLHLTSSHESHHQILRSLGTWESRRLARRRRFLEWTDPVCLNNDTYGRRSRSKRGRKQKDRESSKRPPVAILSMYVLPNVRIDAVQDVCTEQSTSILLHMGYFEATMASRCVRGTE